jgi:hypothetical protein
MKLHIKEMVRWAGHVARMGEIRNAHEILVINHEGMRPFERLRRTWKIILK